MNLISTTHSYRDLRNFVHSLQEKNALHIPHLYGTFLPPPLYYFTINLTHPIMFVCRPLLLTDITFLEEGNPDFIGQLFNVTPLVYLWEVVGGLQERYLEYPIFVIPQVQVRLNFFASVLWRLFSSLFLKHKKTHRKCWSILFRCSAKMTCT